MGLVVEWPAATVSEAFRAWCVARLEYAQRNPRGPLGDPLDVIRGNARAVPRLPAGGGAP